MSEAEIDHYAKQVPSFHWAISATETLLHEIFERDYSIKSRSLREKPEHRSVADVTYNEAEHEKIADQRAIAHFKKQLGIDLTKNILDRFIVSGKSVNT